MEKELILTDAQKKTLREYSKQWLPILTFTSRGDHAKAEDLIRQAYDYHKKPHPKEFIHVSSPKRGLELAFLAKQAKNLKEFNKTKDRTGFDIPDKWEIVSGASFGQFESSWLFFYDFLESINYKMDYTEIHILKALAHEVSFWWPFDEVCIVVERATHFNIDKDNNLHADGEPALGFGDDNRVYFSHGTQIPEKYGSVPSKDWNPEWVFQEDNMQLRAILLREIGMERALKFTKHSVINKQDGYELLDINLSAQFPHARALKMLNPSVPGLIHIEEVPPDINTVQEAINWRTYGDKTKAWNPSVLS